MEICFFHLIKLSQNLNVFTFNLLLPSLFFCFFLSQTRSYNFVQYTLSLLHEFKNMLSGKIVNDEWEIIP